MSSVDEIVDRKQNEDSSSVEHHVNTAQIASTEIKIVVKAAVSSSLAVVTWDNIPEGNFYGSNIGRYPDASQSHVRAVLENADICAA